MTTQALKEEMVAAVDDDSIEERLRDALEAPEPYAEGETPGKMVQTSSPAVAPGGDPAVPGGGSAGTPAVGGFAIETEEGSGWRWAWNTRTHERSRFLTYMLAKKLEEKFEGSNEYVWTTRQPKDADGNVLYPRRGDNLCILHERHPEREYHASLGLPTCRKSNLASPYDARMHAQHRHRQEWGVIEEERTRAREDLDRRAQEATIALAQGRVMEGVVPAVTMNESPEPEVTVSETSAPPTLIQTPCPVCGELLETKKGGFTLKLMHHKKKNHPEA
tara:strand:+ start:8411 stop:9238 length:828 start_codon:yes stop_codon:yes gene_type:complete